MGLLQQGLLAGLPLAPQMRLLHGLQMPTVHKVLQISLHMHQASHWHNDDVTRKAWSRDTQSFLRLCSLMQPQTDLQYSTWGSEPYKVFPAILAHNAELCDGVPRSRGVLSCPQIDPAICPTLAAARTTLPECPSESKSYLSCRWSPPAASGDGPGRW